MSLKDALNNWFGTRGPAVETVIDVDETDAHGDPLPVQDGWFRSGDREYSRYIHKKDAEKYGNKPPKGYKS